MSSYQKYLAQKREVRPVLSETDLTYIRKLIHEEASRRGVEVLVTQSVIGDQYYLVAGGGNEEQVGGIYFELTLPSTYTVDQIVEVANKHW